MDVKQFLEAQQAEGALEGEGSFSVDLNAATAKLRQHQLPSPSHYLLKTIQAAVRAETGEIAITREKFRTRISFLVAADSPITDLALLMKTLAEPLSNKQGGLSHLVAALGGALSTDHQEIVYRLEFPNRCLELTLSPHVDIKEASGSYSVEEHQCRCTLERREKRAILKLFFGLRERMTEARLLSSNSANSPVEVKLDGCDIGAAWEPRFHYRPTNFAKGSKRFHAFQHYVVGDDSSLGQTLPTRSYDNHDHLHLWKAALWGKDELALPIGLASSYGLAFLDESGRTLGQRIARRMVFSRALALDISLDGPTIIFPVCDGVVLSPIELKLYPGLAVLDWDPSFSVDLSGFAVIQDEAFMEYLARLKPQYQRLVEHAYRIRELVKTIYEPAESNRPWGWAESFEKAIGQLKDEQVK